MPEIRVLIQKEALTPHITLTFSGVNYLAYLWYMQQMDPLMELIALPRFRHRGLGYLEKCELDDYIKDIISH